MENNKVYSRKEYINKIEDKEINIYELIKYILNQWKIAVSLSVIFFIICIALAVFVFKSGSDSNSEMSIEQLTEEQQNRTKSLLNLYDALKDMEEYKNSSAYMNLNAYECNVNVLQYLVTDKTAAGNSFKAYKAFAESGQLKKQIEEEAGELCVKPSDLIIVSANPQSVLGDGDAKMELQQVISIKIVTDGEAVNNKITEVVKRAFEEQHKYLDTIIEDHDIMLLAENSYVGTDGDIRNGQSAFEIEMDRKRTQITNIEAKLSGEESTLVKQIRAGEEESSEKQGGGMSRKLLVVIFVLSVGFSCFILACRYLFCVNNKVKNGEEIVSIFGLSCIGEVSKKNVLEDGIILQEEIEILISKNNLQKVYLSLLTESKTAEEVVKRLKEELKEKKIELAVGGNVAVDVEAMKEVQRFENIILVSESKRTGYYSIDKVLQKCDNWGINVLGVINYKG